MEVTFWFALFVILLVIEIFTLGLTTIWFAGGALASLILARLDVSVPIQVLVFLAVSIVLLVVTRPIAMKFFNQERKATNTEMLIGQQGIVLEEIDTIRAQGRVDVHGQEWSAKTEDPVGVIPAGTVVLIEGIQGVKLVVKQKEE